MLGIFCLLLIAYFILDRHLFVTVVVRGRRYKVSESLKPGDAIYRCTYYPDGDLESETRIDSETEQLIHEALFPRQIRNILDRIT